MDNINGSAQKTQMTIVAVACCIAYCNLLFYKNKRYININISEKEPNREVVRKELMYRIETEERIRGVLRMGPTAFKEFVKYYEKNIPKRYYT